MIPFHLQAMVAENVLSHLLDRDRDGGGDLGSLCGGGGELAEESGALRQFAICAESKKNWAESPDAGS